jgi:hypothetical protein
VLYLSEKVVDPGSVELLATNQKTRKCSPILFLMGAQIFLTAPGCAQTVLMPQPPQLGAKNHVVSLTLHAVSENGRDAFAFNRGTLLR